MRFSSLGSGSRGNAALVEQGQTCVLVDCGFSVVEIERRMGRLGRHPSELTAIVVTHEHSDHISGVARLTRKYSMPVWMTPGTADAPAASELKGFQPITGYGAFEIQDLQVCPFPVPHDAREPSQFVFSNGVHRLGFLTDTGSITDHIVNNLKGCGALFLECNHDRKMLADGPYPDTLKRRVGGRFGHLENRQAADLLSRLDTSQLQHVVASHLSEKNNKPQKARAALAEALGCSHDWIEVADQAHGLAWRELT